jgi:hypothetical protein
MRFIALRVNFDRLNMDTSKKRKDEMKQVDPLSYFEIRDYTEIGAAETFETLRDIAFRVLLRMPEEPSMVCGPIMFGTASPKESRERFDIAIDMLAMSGKNLFTQLPFDDALQRISTRTDRFEGGRELLRTFYLPLFQSQKVAKLYFLPDWDTSRGAVWQHDRAMDFEIDCEYFRADFDASHRLLRNISRK